MGGRTMGGQQVRVRWKGRGWTRDTVMGAGTAAGRMGERKAVQPVRCWKGPGWTRGREMGAGTAAGRRGGRRGG